MTTTPRRLTPDDLGATVSFRNGRLTVTGVLQRFDPQTAIEHDGGGTESNTLLGPIDLTIVDGWFISFTVTLPPDHPITLKEDR